MYLGVMPDDTVVVVAAVPEEGDLGVPGGDGPLPVPCASRPRKVLPHPQLSPIYTK